MSKRASAITVFVILCLVCVAHALYYYPSLPEHVALHFDASGKPDASGNKVQVLVIYIFTIVVMVATFLGFGLLLPKLSDSAINLPNKDYWLAPERRQQTLDYIISRFLWLGSLTMILLLVVFDQSFQVHLGNATKLEHFWIIIAIYLALTTWVCIALYRRFQRKDS